MATTTAVDITSLPGTPAYVDVLLCDHMQRDEDPEAYDACREYLVNFMTEMGLEEPVDLGWYSPYMAGFMDGFIKARQMEAYERARREAALSHE